MNLKYEAIDKLRHYAAKKNALESIPEELRRLEEASVAIRSSTGDSSPVKGGGNGWEDRMLNNIARREELGKCLTIVTNWMIPVERALNLMSEEERLVLDSFYIHPAKGCVDRLCEALGCEKTTVYRRRDDALFHFTVALYGCTEV